VGGSPRTTSPRDQPEDPQRGERHQPRPLRHLHEAAREHRVGIRRAAPPAGFFHMIPNLKNYLKHDSTRKLPRNRINDSKAVAKIIKNIKLTIKLNAIV